MKRSRPPQRRKYLKASRRPIAPRRADPQKRTYAKHRCKPFTEWLKTQACRVTGKQTGEWYWCEDGYPLLTIVDPAHLIPRGRGAPDLYNCVSLARHLHERQEKRTDQFNAEHGVNLWELAKQQTEEWLATADGLAVAGRTPHKRGCMSDGPQPICHECEQPLGAEPCGPFHGSQQRGLLAAVANNRRLLGLPPQPHNPPACKCDGCRNGLPCLAITGGVRP